jgi:hypothetical protein
MVEIFMLLLLIRGTPSHALLGALPLEPAKTFFTKKDFGFQKTLSAPKLSFRVCFHLFLPLFFTSSTPNGSLAHPKFLGFLNPFFKKGLSGVWGKAPY